MSVRLDDETLARVDALSPHLSTRWRSATRSDIIRALILSALDTFEREAAAAAEAAAPPRPSPPPPPKKGQRRARR